MDSEDQRHREELFQDTCKRLHASDDMARDQVRKHIDEIAMNLKRNKAAAKAAKDAPTLGEARPQFDAAIKFLEGQDKYLNLPETLLHYGSTATDNPHADPAIGKRAAERQEATFDKLQEAKAANEALLADLRGRRENPSWERARGTIPSMTGGTPASDFAADCVKLFEHFRPGKSSWKPESDCYVIAANIYELITGKSLIEEGADFSLEHRLKETIKQRRRTVS